MADLETILARRAARARVRAAALVAQPEQEELKTLVMETWRGVAGRIAVGNTAFIFANLFQQSGAALTNPGIVLALRPNGNSAVKDAVDKFRGQQVGAIEVTCTIDPVLNPAGPTPVFEVETAIPPTTPAVSPLPQPVPPGQSQQPPDTQLQDPNVIQFAADVNTMLTVANGSMAMVSVLSQHSVDGWIITGALSIQPLTRPGFDRAKTLYGSIFDQGETFPPEDVFLGRTCDPAKAKALVAAQQQQA